MVLTLQSGRAGKTGGEKKPQTRSPENWPSIYRKWRGSSLGALTDRIERGLIFGLTGELPGKTVLDVGCGDGAISLPAAERGAEVFAVDASAEACQAARRNAQIRGRQIALQVGNAQHLPYSTGTFDVVLAVTVLCFLEDAAGALREMARVVRPGGKLVIGELGRWSLWALGRRLRGFMGSALWRKARFRTPAGLRCLAEDAGLRVNAVRGAIYYPPLAAVAHLMAPFDHRFDGITKFGAAFLVLDATKQEEIRV